MVAERPTGDIVVRPLATTGKAGSHCYHGCVKGEPVCADHARYMVMWRYERP